MEIGAVTLISRRNDENFRQDYRIDLISKRGMNADPVYRESLS